MNQFLGSFALIPIENILNAIIKRDAHIARQLLAFDDKYIEVLSTKPEFSLILRFQDNSIKLSAIDSQTLGIQADATIAATAEKLFGLLMQASNERALADTAIKISGDASLIQDLYTLADSLDVDWQDYLAPLLGDILSNELGKFADASRVWGKAAGESMQRNVHDYLSEEARLVPSKTEVESFGDRLDQLRLGIDRAMAKTELLKRRLELVLEKQ